MSGIALDGPSERATNSALALRHRQSVLTWCAQAALTARPLAFSNRPLKPGNPFLPVAGDVPPVVELARALEFTASNSPVGLPTIDDLTTTQPNETVEHWRRAARAAALAEHDTGPDLHGRLTTPQAHALLGDVAVVTQALIVLDHRYALIPGWERLAGSRRLAWCALACALDVGLGEPDYSVDRLGWTARGKVIGGPVKPGILGVLQAQHNLVVRLRIFPNALNLRRVVDSQRILSAGLADLARTVAPDLGRSWAERSETYAAIQRQLRNIGGNLGGKIGTGGLAAAEGANAVSRLQHVPADTIIEPRVLAGFETLFTHVDRRVGDIIEEGVRRGAYVQRVTVPEVTSGARRMVHPLEERYVVVSEPAELEVITTVRKRLLPRAAQPQRQRPDPSRVDLHLALAQDPEVRGRGLGF
ncbi:hypothetical protein KVF89_25640 [Nocardioides carbamazepini]|uniref:hypothetical protein n=1 Tax=Nocardioides carbamazepini TaxID=2854259 RepID=UPI002149D186|nr:hypothetical protein [Nocardioides carbamazepini]MCR1785944.1 hypothetical protein [Nocardioides carbamazepini]